MTDNSQREPALSVIVPMYNEEGAAAHLVDEIASALAGVEHEIVIVDDGSTDGTLAALKSARARHPQLRIMKHRRNAGQSRAIRTGVEAARAPVVAMIDGDGQNDPSEIPALHEALSAGGPPLAMIAGERRERRDSWGKRAASRFANALRRRILRDGAVDTGCGLKVFRRDAFMALPYFDHMHRYLPALMVREGFGVVFMRVSHRPRRSGASKYNNIGRGLAGVRDLMGVAWLVSRSRRPGEITEES